MEPNACVIRATREPFVSPEHRLASMDFSSGTSVLAIQATQDLSVKPSY